MSPGLGPASLLWGQERGLGVLLPPTPALPTLPPGSALREEAGCSLGPGTVDKWQSRYPAKSSCDLGSGVFCLPNGKCPVSLACCRDKAFPHCALTSALLPFSPSATSYGVQEVNHVKRLTGPGLSEGPNLHIQVMIRGGPWPTR